MTRPRAAALATLLASLPACGARTELDTDAEPATRESEPAPTYRCAVGASGDDARPMLVATIEAQMYLAFESGRVTAPFRFDVPEGMYVAGSAVIARGDRLAAYAHVSPLGSSEGLEHFFHAVVLDVGGGIVWEAKLPFEYSGTGTTNEIRGNSRGLFVFTFDEVDAQLGVTVRGDTHTSWTDPFSGVGDPDADGRMLALAYGSGSGYHFYDTVAQTFTPSEHLLSVASSAAVVDGALLYLDTTPPHAIHETAGGTRVLSLFAELPPDSHPGAASVASNGWTYFSTTGPQYLALRFATGEQTPLFSLQAPAGHSVAELPAGHGIDAEGMLLVWITENLRLRLHRTRDGADWEPIGKEIGGYGAVEITEAGLTYVIRAHGDGGPAEDHPGVLWGGSTQVVRLDTGLEIELSRGSTPPKGENPNDEQDTLSPDGSCFAYFRDGSLHAVEARTGRIADLGIASTAWASDDVAIAWIAEP